MSSASPAYTAHARPTVWLSDAKLSQGIPWFRAVLDAMLISLGSFLALVSMWIFGSTVEISNWKLAVYFTPMAVMGCTGLLIALKTSYSNRLKDRQQILIGLSILLFLFSGLSLASLLVDSPQLTKDITLFCCAIAAWVLICIALIAIEKRLAQSPTTKQWTVETTAGLKQTAFRLWKGIFTGLAAVGIVGIPIVSLYQISQGTFYDQAIEEYGRALGSIEATSFLILTAFHFLCWLSFGVVAASQLSNLHRHKNDANRLLEIPWVACGVLSSMTYIITLFLFAVLIHGFGVGAEALPWMVVVTVVGSFVACRYGLDDLKKNKNSATP